MAQEGLETGTIRTDFFEEPKPEPSLSVKTIMRQKSTFAEKNCRNRKPEPLKPARTVTEANRGHPEFYAIHYFKHYKKKFSKTNFKQARLQMNGEYKGFSLF